MHLIELFELCSILYITRLQTKRSSHVELSSTQSLPNSELCDLITSKLTENAFFFFFGKCRITFGAVLGANHPKQSGY